MVLAGFIVATVLFVAGVWLTKPPDDPQPPTWQKRNPH